jgi:hypothetical protein
MRARGLLGSALAAIVLTLDMFVKRVPRSRRVVYGATAAGVGTLSLVLVFYDLAIAWSHGRTLTWLVHTM